MNGLVLGFIMGLGQRAKGPEAPAWRAAFEVHAMVNRLVSTEDRATLNGNRAKLASVFVPGNPGAQKVYQKALQRMAYLHQWSLARQITWDGVRVSVATGQPKWQGPAQVAVCGADQAAYQYHHLVGNGDENEFGMGVYHRYVLRRVGPTWYILDDQFIDPLNQDTRLSKAALPALVRVRPERRPTKPMNRGAEQAIRYAQSFCGAAPGCRHNHRYHPAFRDYNGNGGDCTNFISQILHAGGFRESKTWSGSGDGTPAWVNAVLLGRYLTQSSHAVIYARGRLPSLIAAPANGRSALDRLRLGDLIGYEEHGCLAHFAVVVGFDSDGYPLVISHSADRYRVPWDLGWDHSTQYVFFHVRYPDR